MRTRLVVLGLAMTACWLLLEGAWGLSQPPYQQFPPRQFPPGQGPQPQPGQNPAPGRVQPKLEALAETRLLMEGLAQANFRGVEKILNQKPTEDQAWKFGRGQALLLAETGNLLMLRPPHNEGEPVWFQRAADYRNWAVYLAQCLAIKDYDRSRAALVGLANTCNRCHQTFRVPVQIRAFEDQPKVSQ